MKIKILIIILGVIFLNCKKSKEVKTSNNDTISTLIETSEIHEAKNAEIVFCLDATGSMSGLIGTAKEKIWDIVSELAQDNDIDTLKMGMVFYRDRGPGAGRSKLDQAGEPGFRCHRHRPYQ